LYQVPEYESAIIGPVSAGLGLVVGFVFTGRYNQPWNTESAPERHGVPSADSYKKRETDGDGWMKFILVGLGLLLGPFFSFFGEPFYNGHTESSAYPGAENRNSGSSIFSSRRSGWSLA